MYRWPFVILLSALLISGCTTTKTSTIVDSPLVGAQFAGASTLSGASHSPIPNWAGHSPKPDKIGVFGVGRGQTNNMDQAIVAAKASAKRNLATNVIRHLYGPANPSKDSEVDNTLRAKRISLLNKVIDEAPDSDFGMMEQQVLMQNGIFTGYSLLKLSYFNLEGLVNQQIQYSSDKKFKQALNEIQTKLRQAMSTAHASNISKSE